MTSCRHVKAAPGQAGPLPPLLEGKLVKTKIKYTTAPTSKWVRWQLQYEDGSGIHLFVCSENGAESNRKKAKKAAEHAKRLTDAALSKKAGA